MLEPLTATWLVTATAEDEVTRFPLASVVVTTLEFSGGRGQRQIDDSRVTGHNDLRLGDTGTNTRSHGRASAA